MKMKACIIQPPYSTDVSFCDEYFDYKLNLLDECDNSIDIIVKNSFFINLSLFFVTF